MEIPVLFCCLLFVVAFLYASVGHGGASGYLALMALFSFSPSVMKPTALVLNLFVSLVSFIQFYKGGHFRWKLFWPFALASVPLAYLGGLIVVDGNVYKKILGLLLFVPIIRFYFSRTNVEATKEPLVIPSLLIGGAIGFLSGLIGIGGGILLSPIVLLLQWADQKQAAALSALFIFVNSVAGLAGQFTKGISFTPAMYFFIIIAFAGGLCGAWLGSIKFRQIVLKNILATVLVLAAYKLLLTHA